MTYKIIFSIFIGLILLNTAGAFERTNMSFDTPEVGETYNTSEFSNISGPEKDELFDHANNNPVNQKHSSKNWIADRTEDQKGTDSPEENTGEKPEPEKDKDGGSSNTHSDTVVKTERSWSVMNAALSQSSADSNETVYIQGSITGNRKQKLLVFLGEEKISEKGPLNGSFRIPVEASTIDGRELRIESNGRSSTFDLKVNPIEEVDAVNTPGLSSSECASDISHKPFDMEQNHHLNFIGTSAYERIDCFNSSMSANNPFDVVENSQIDGDITQTPDHRDLGGFASSNPYEDVQQITGQFTHSNIDELSRDISTQLERIQKEASSILNSFLN